MATQSILGISAAMLVGVAVAGPTGAATRDVSVSKTNPTAPYTTSASAANVSREAVDVAQPGAPRCCRTSNAATRGQ